MSNENTKIHFIITGGTIDSHYDGTKDTVVPNEKSIIPGYIKSLKLKNPIEFTTICMKDSRDLNKQDLDNIINTIEKSQANYFVITHGTYTMPDSARFLEANLKNNKKTIIFTAAMLPMSQFIMSDGGFNLGYAVGKIQDLDSGVYVCMNGKIFSSTNVIKIISEGTFACLFGEE